MSEITVVDNPSEVVIEIEGGPVLTTTVTSEQQTVVSTQSDPVIVDLNSGGRGEPGSALLSGPYYPTGSEGSVGDVFIITGGSEQEYVGAVLSKSVNGWTVTGNIRGPVGGIDSVNGHFGPTVVVTKANVGLGNVDNTTDLLKPVSTATQTALDLKADDNEIVRLTGAQTIAGVKTFSNTISVAGPIDVGAAAGGLSTFTNNNAGPASASLEIKNGSGTPGLYFHQPGISDGILRLNSDYSFSFSNSVGTGLVDVRAGQFIGNGTYLSALNADNVSLGTIADTRLSTNVVLLTGAQTISGPKTFTSLALFNAAEAIRVGTGQTQGFISYYTDSTNPTVRSGYVGFGSPGNPVMHLINSRSLGTILIQTPGIVNVNTSELQENGVRVATVNTAATLSGAQSITGVKTFTVSPIVPTPSTDFQISTKKYVDDAIFVLTNGAPALLNTLDELSAALGDDANFATTMTNNLASKVSLTGNQTVAGQKTFSNDTHIKAGLYLTPAGNAVIEMGRTDGVASTPYIDFHSSATATDFDVRFLVGAGNATAGNGSLDITANGGINFYGTMTGNGGGLTSLNASNLSFGTIADARLSANVVLLTGAQTITARKVISISGVTAQGYLDAGLELRTDINGHPRISFHRTGAVASQIRLATNGNIQVVDNPGTAFEGFEAADIYDNGNRVYSASNPPDNRYSTLEQAGNGATVVRNLVAYGAQSGNMPRYMRINTNLPSTSANMVRIHITGKTHAYVGAFEGYLTMYLYNLNGGTLYEPAWESGSGAAAPNVYVAKNASNNLVIVLDWPALWGYPDIVVDEAVNSFSTYVASYYQGWTVTNHADNTGLTAVALATTQNTAVRRVVHGADAAFARPLNAKYVEWVGTVNPTNALTNDTWVNTA